MTPRGFMQDPETDLGRIYNPITVAFESIGMTPCLILLGEPGIGKSHALDAERANVQQAIRGGQDKLLILDLRSYGAEARLIADLFESRTYTEWATGQYHLHLFLDSLDECLLRIDTIAGILVDNFRGAPIDRLSLRVACRTADWPSFLETELTKLWSKDSVGVYELAPLTESNVAEAAAANRIDPVAFIDEVVRREAGPLAHKPVTLQFLLNTYQRRGAFPSTQRELYQEGCRVLCEEMSQQRRAARLVGRLTADQRLAIASRIAAVTIFSNRYAVWTDVDLGDVPQEDVSLRDLYGIETGLTVDETALRETLNTGLFSSRGPNRMGWAHQTYAEFLAAHFVTQHQLALPQIQSLLTHSGEQDRHLVPQLYESAAWLASMRPDVFRDIVTFEPQVLLRSDVATADPADRATLVAELLTSYTNEKILDPGWGAYVYYTKLVHPGLVEQLRRFISDQAAKPLARNVAIDIAEACKLQPLQEDLLNLALNQIEPEHIRVDAALAVSRIGDSAARARLLPLALHQAGDDPRDELKGSGLLAVWPEHLSAERLFQLLTPPRNPNFHGAYISFVDSELVSHLTPADLSVALRWVAASPVLRLAMDPFEDAREEVILKAWEHLDAPGVLQALAAVVIARIRHLDPILRDVSVRQRPRNSLATSLATDAGKRRLLFTALLPLLVDPDEDASLVTFARPQLIVPQDVQWLIELAQTAHPVQQLVIGHIIDRLLDRNDMTMVESVYGAILRFPVLESVLSHLFKAIEFNSPEAQRMQEAFLTSQRWEQEAQRRPPRLEPPPAVRVTQLLDAIAAGQIDRWWHLNMDLTLGPESTHYGNEFQPDLVDTPGWQAADPTTRARILQAAQHYVEQYDAQTDQWLGQENVIYRPALAGFRALWLLTCMAPEVVHALPAKVWKQWAPIVLAFPIAGNGAQTATMQELTRLCLENAADEMFATLDHLIATSDFECRHAVDRLRAFWDARLAAALLRQLNTFEPTSERFKYLLGVLLEHAIPEALQIGESLITVPPPHDDPNRANALSVARLLAVYSARVAWPLIWSVILSDDDFGQKLAISLAIDSFHSADRLAQQLRDDQIGDLFVWLARQYPPAEDPQHEGVHEISDRDEIAMWRDSLLNGLGHMGTQSSVDVIRRIMRELPHIGALKWTLAQAQLLTRQRTWVPLQPSYIYRLAEDHDARLVQSGDELLNIVVESLHRLEAKLHGETPLIEFLWDRITRNRFRPKDENSLSNFVKNHLDEDVRRRGIVVNREVEIRRALGSSAGQRTDIHVDGVTRHDAAAEHDRITLIVEVKGNWNPELPTGMRDQLVNRYLTENHCQHGIYLIGWYSSDKWDGRDNRKRRVPRTSLAEARIRYEDQATQLSVDGTLVRTLLLDTSLR